MFRKALAALVRAPFDRLPEMCELLIVARLLVATSRPLLRPAK